jgi:hypothetical protein
MEGFESACVFGRKDVAVQILSTALSAGTFDADNFMESIYSAAAEDDKSDVRDTLAAVCNIIERDAQDLWDKLDLNTSCFSRGADWCWVPISGAYVRYYSLQMPEQPNFA